jgi:hypothetical protein
VERSPRRIILLKPYYMLLQELEPCEEIIRLSGHYNGNTFNSS